MKIRFIFFCGFLINFIVFLIGRSNPIGVISQTGLHFDLFSDFELYSSEKSFLSFITFKNEVVLAIFIFLMNMANGLILYKITLNEEIVMIYYFNPLTLFYFSMMLLNTTVFTFFILVSFYYLEKEQYFQSILFYVIALLMKQYAIVFSLIILYKIFRNPYVSLLILVGFCYLFISINVLNLNIISELRFRLTTLSHDYSVSLFPRQMEYAVLSYIMLTIVVFFTLSDKNLDLLQKTAISLLYFDLLGQFGICKYYIFCSLMFALLNNVNLFLYSSFVLFFIPRQYLMIYILCLIILIKFTKRNEK